MSEAAALIDTDLPTIPNFVKPRSERRSSPRVPARGPVSVGPPQREPHARLTASDLSTGGMFIDADRPVRVGARFCAELVLSDGARVYVPQAEVAYNRDRPDGSGFGVRFIELSEEAKRLLAEEVMRLRVESSGEDIDLELSIPPPASLSPSPSDSLPHAWPSVEIDADDDDAVLVLPADTDPGSQALVSTAPVRVGRPPAQMKKAKSTSNIWTRLRTEVRATAAQLPSLWAALAALGAGLLIAAVSLVVWAELSQAPRVPETVPTDGPTAEGPAAGFTSETHRRLTGTAEPEPIPVLVPLAPKPAKDDDSTEARRPERAARRATSATRAWATMALPSGVRVRRTSQLRAPPRFMVDFDGLDTMPDGVEVDERNVRGVRFGRHEGFGRIVFDLHQRGIALQHRVQNRNLRIEPRD